MVVLKRRFLQKLVVREREVHNKKKTPMFTPSPKKSPRKQVLKTLKTLGLFYHLLNQKLKRKVRLQIFLKPLTKISKILIELKTILTINYLNKNPKYNRKL